MEFIPLSNNVILVLGTNSNNLTSLSLNSLVFPVLECAYLCRTILRLYWCQQRRRFKKVYLSLRMT